MTLNEYQKAAERTSGNLSPWDKIRNGCYGLNGEAGECIDLLKKVEFRSPASTRFHGATEGGLYRHSASVMRFLVQLTKDNGLHWQRKISPYIVGMFHDLCKIDQYRCERQENTILWEYNPDTLFKGHGEKSVMLLSQFFQLTEEEIACIRYHMGAFTPEKEWNDYTRAVKMWPNVLWTHHADMLASHVEGV
jgi:hypothetical protein